MCSADEIRFFDDIPDRISVYGEANRLGGITFYQTVRKHYSEYIPLKGKITLYDGLPKDSPLLRKFRLRAINGGGGGGGGGCRYCVTFRWMILLRMRISLAQ